MSDDLISRTAALDIINAELNGWLTEDERLHLEGVGTGIELLPTAKPEIVRCRDCKHYTQGYTAPMCTNRIVKYVKPDDFCSWGEREEHV